MTSDRTSASALRKITREEPEKFEPTAIPMLGLLFEELRHTWYPELHAKAAFSGHGKALDELFQRMKDDPRLRFLDAQFYPEWSIAVDHLGEPAEFEPWLPDDVEQFRAAFYFCNSLIQLMENVYLDLDLSRTHDHPDNRGWINLFQHWAWSGMFRVTWTISASTYGIRFQRFAQDHLRLSLGDVELELRPREAGSSRRKAAAKSSGRSPRLAQRVRSMFRGARRGGLINFLEEEKLLEFFEKHDERIGALELAVFLLRVDSPRTKDRKRFPFGVALLHGEDLIYFRVQNHLRKMGLARRALRQLLQARAVRRVDDSFAPEHLKEAAAELSRVYHRVRRELRAKSMVGPDDS